jgi:cell division protein FtsB
VHPTVPDRIIGHGSRSRLGTQTMIWAILFIAAALLVATLSEAWTRADAEAQVQAAQARNAALRQDVAATQQAITLAQADQEIERAARRWGYIRSGDTPVIVVPQGTTSP